MARAGLDSGVRHAYNARLRIGEGTKYSTLGGNNSFRRMGATMNFRARFYSAVVVALVLLWTLPVAARQRVHYTTAEYNEWMAAKIVENAEQKVSAYEAFIQKYPDSVLRVYIYPDLVNSLYAAKQPEKVLSTVDQFLGLDQGVYAKLDITQAQMQPTFYGQHRTYCFVVLEMLGAGQQVNGSVAQGALNHARTGLQMLRPVAEAQKAAGADPKQMDDVVVADELMYHRLMATLAWRKKDYDSSVNEFTYLLEKMPDNPNLTFQMGYSQLNRSQPDPLKAIWYLARAVALKHSDSKTARQMMVRQMVRRIGVAPACMESDINGVIEQSGGSLHPPAGWTLITDQDINTARQGITYVGLFSQLAEGGDAAHLTWLAACRLPFGLGEQEEATYEAVLLEVVEAPAGDASADSDSSSTTPETQAEGEGGAEQAGPSVTIRVAATQEALLAKIPNLEIVLTGFSDMDALRKKVDETIKIGGIIESFQIDPQFLIRLTAGKVDLTDVE